MTMTESPPIADWAPPQQPVSVHGTEPAKNRAFKVLVLLAVLALAASAFIVASLAVFTDTAVVDDNNFTTGNVDISTNPTTAAFTVTAMAPGDEVVSPITVTNAGSLDLRYAVDSLTVSGSQPLADELVLTMSLVANAAHCTVPTWDDGTGTGGTIIAGTAGTLSENPARQVFGDPTQGAQAGDRVLTASASEILCVHVTLPLTADNTFEGLTVQAEFGFDAEQVRNNP